MRSIITAALLVCLLPSARAADEENAFKKAEVGDWAEYKMTSSRISCKTKMIVVAKDDKEAAYEVEAIVLSATGNEITPPLRKLKIDLTKPFEPIRAANVAEKYIKLSKIETEGEGNEKIKLGDKEFDTKWIKFKRTTTINNNTHVVEYKMWFSKDVPLSGMVKMETSSPAPGTIWELVHSGKK